MGIISYLYPPFLFTFKNPVKPMMRKDVKMGNARVSRFGLGNQVGY